MITRPNYFLHANSPERAEVARNVHALIDRLPLDKSYVVTFGLYEKSQTKKQRGALFGVAYATIMEHMGLRGADDKKALHKFFCCEYWGRKTVPMLGEQPVRTTTTNENGERDPITWKVAVDFYDFIQQRAAEQMISIPDPDPLWRTKEGTI